VSDEAIPNRIRLALNIDTRLADHLAALLANVRDLQLVGATEAADAVILLPTAAPSEPDGDPQLTPREQEEWGKAAVLCKLGGLT
jgi:hypothetical protein